MRPKLKISNLTNLQDARSSAAVGFDMISFNLERGHHKKLSASLIWNMVNWLSGPEIGLEMNTYSLEELKEIKKLFDPSMLTFPATEWNPLLLEYADAIMLRGDQFTDPKHIQQWVSAAETEEKKLKVVLSLPDLAAAGAYEGVKESILLHFPSLDLLVEFIRTSPFQPYGFSLDQEAEEEPGVLHYERIDDLMEVLEEQYPA